MAGDDDIPDDELLALPASAIPASSALWARRAAIIHQRDATELDAELAGDRRARMLFADHDPRLEKARREQEAQERLLEEFREQSDRLLVRIEDYQAQIQHRRREIDSRAIRLRDGRKVYIDGALYRDENGYVLHGGDETEAAAQRRPQTATWQEHQEIERQAVAAERLRQKVEQERGGEGDLQAANQRLGSYEQDLQKQIDARQATVKPADYADTDYMSLSSAPAFNAAAPLPAPETEEPRDSDTETVAAQNRKSARPVARPGMKPC